MRAGAEGIVAGAGFGIAADEATGAGAEAVDDAADIGIGDMDDGADTGAGAEDIDIGTGAGIGTAGTNPGADGLPLAYGAGVVVLAAVVPAVAALRPIMPTGIENIALLLGAAVAGAALPLAALPEPDAGVDAEPAAAAEVAKGAAVLAVPSGAPVSVPVGFCVVVPGISAPQAMGVSVAVFEFAVPALFVARTQYDTACVIGGVVKLVDVAPGIGFDVSPLTPRYH